MNLISVKLGTKRGDNDIEYTPEMLTMNCERAH